MKTNIYEQKISDLEKIYRSIEIEDKKYRGRVPKNKRIRNKIYKRRKKERLSKFYMDEFHMLN